MKKTLLSLALLLPLALSATDAAAQRKNNTNHDVLPASDMMTSDEEMPAQTMHEHKKHKKSDKHKDEHGYKIHKMFKKSPEEWLSKENGEINEEYREAVAKINKSTLPQVDKDLLLKQAAANKELALKQAQEKMELLKQNWQEREDFSQELLKEKANRKAIKEVDDIL